MPLAACSTRLPIVNMPSVQVCQACSSCDTCGKSAPFRVGAKFELLSAPLQDGLRFLPHLLPAPQFPFPYGRATRWLYTLYNPESGTGLPRSTSFTDRVRTPLYTGWVDGCVGLPLKLADLPTMPFWLWSRMVALAPRLSRCVTPRLWLPYPYRSFPEVRLVCHSPFVLLPSAWDPAVASDAPLVREQVTPHHG